MLHYGIKFTYCDFSNTFQYLEENKETLYLLLLGNRTPFINLGKNGKFGINVVDPMLNTRQRPL